MALTVNEYRRPTASIKRDGRTYQRFYHVIADTAAEALATGPLSILAAVNAVGRVLGETFSFGSDSDAGAFLADFGIEPMHDDEGSRRKWHVTCNYTTTPAKEEKDIDTDPVDEPAEISGSFAQFTRLADRDNEGNILVNTAFERFRVEVDDSRINLVIKKNLASVDFATWRSFKDAVNTDTFWYLGARNWKVMNISPTLARRGNGTFYFPTTFEFSAAEDTWDWKGFSEGYYRRSLVTTTKNVVITDEDGQPINAPRLLDVNGQPVDIGVTTIGTAAGEIYPLEKRIYPEMAFAGLSVPMNDSQL